MYCSCVLLNVPRSLAAGSEGFFGLNFPGCETNPEPRPRPRGSSIETGALEKIDAGSVRPGTYAIAKGQFVRRCMHAQVRNFDTMLSQQAVLEK